MSEAGGVRNGGAAAEAVGDAGPARSENRGGHAEDGRLGVAILGSTGSIGASALQVIERHRDRFRVAALTANRSVELLGEQVERHAPACVVVCDEDAWGRCDTGGERWSGGREALIETVTRPDVDVVINALVGFAGLEPTLRALEAGKRLALANKESLVAGGDLVLEAVRRGGGELIPVDSEHSAILQSLGGRPSSEVERLVLTASGGPFRGWSRSRLGSAGPRDALRHPTWDMGAKITIDSATLANKALEVIEAHFLYGLPYERIDAVVHPQSVIHSLVEFVDGSVVAQLGFPTMELPILYALTHPERVPDARLRTFDPVRSSPLTFEEIDGDSFPLFEIGTRAGRAGGTAPAAFNAANEVAVQAFLEETISFPMIADVVDHTLTRVSPSAVRDLSDVIEADREARRVAGERVGPREPSMPGADE